MKFRRRQWLLALGILLAVQLALFAGFRWLSRADESTSPVAGFETRELAPARVPALRLLQPNGRRLDLASLRGRPVLLHFWATWCEPCARELPELLQFARELGPQRVSLVALSVDHDLEVVKTFFGGDVPPEVVLGDAREAKRELGVETLPDTYLIAKNGIITHRMLGEQNWRSRQAKVLLDAAR